MTPEARERALKRIIDPSQPSASFYLLVCLSAVIATFGLLANSTAVVIGAMLVAPLMGPIFGIALALSTGDRRLLKTAVFAEVVGIILAVALPTLIGLIPLRPDFGTEILARTQPTIYDVLIALASGLAGAYALVDEKISPALPGVAIATALVPPLAACGLNIAAGNWSLAWGAFLLFSINFIAIEFAAASIFMILGVVEFPHISNGYLIKNIIRRLGISFIILFLAAAFVTQTLITIINERKLDDQIRAVLTEQLNTYAGARLSDIKWSQSQTALDIRAVVITPQEFDPQRVASLQDALQAKVSPNSQLIVRSVISKDADQNGPVFISAEELQKRSKVTQEEEYMNRVSLIVSEQLKSVTGAQVSSVTKEVVEGIPEITASVRTYQAVTPSEVLTIQQQLNDEVDKSIKLIIRSTVTRDADAQQFLHQASAFRDSLKGEDLILYDSLLNEITWYLSQDNPGISVAGLNFQQENNTVSVKASVNTPATLNPAEVNALQRHLKETVDPSIQIAVHSIVGGTATAESYTTWSE
jgi:uncharacterized hydrophobic protein (TIGR00271 family)